MTPRYKSGPAFKSALNQRIKTQAHTVGRRPMELLREFFIQRFLTRVFSELDAAWILKGGTGLLVRMPGARHSRDVDLLHLVADLDDAFTELRRIGTARSPLDPFTFEIEAKARHLQGATEGMQLNATPYMGVTALEAFPINLTVHRELVGEVDRVAPVPVVDIEDLALPLPEFSCFPLPDQIADKVAAMYERHGVHGTPSNRYRDLVDLVLLTRQLPFDAADTRAALHTQGARRSSLVLPNAIHSPGAQWASGYRELARGTILPPELHALSPALECVGACLNPLLDSTVTAGTWNPLGQVWELSGSTLPG